MNHQLSDQKANKSILVAYQFTPAEPCLLTVVETNSPVVTLQSSEMKRLGMQVVTFPVESEADEQFPELAWERHIKSWVFQNAVSMV